MSIFESLENLNVSEECFDDIMDIVEEILSEEDKNKYEEDLVTRRWFRKPYWQEPMSKTKKHYKGLNTRLKYFRSQFEKNGEEKADQEWNRAEKSERTIHANRGDHTDFHRGNDLSAISNKDYPKYKKIATKALKGHSRNSVDTTHTDDEGYEEKSTSPKALYRIGKKVEKHNKKENK